MPIEDDDKPVPLPIAYIGAEDVPIVYGNQFAVQFLQDEFILTVGQLAPPILLGTPEQQREQIKRVSLVPVKVVARVALTRARFTELLGLMQQQLGRFDEQRQEGNQ